MKVDNQYSPKSVTLINKLDKKIWGETNPLRKEKLGKKWWLTYKTE